LVCITGTLAPTRHSGQSASVSWLRRGSPTEWAIWTAAFSLGLPGFGEGLHARDLAWAVPVAALISDVLLPWLTRFRRAAFDLGNASRRRQSTSQRDD
jgi:hypothetical protein